MTVPLRYQALLVVAGVPIAALLVVLVAIALRPLSFWLFSAAAILASVTGLMSRSRFLLVSGAVLAAPLFLYVGSSPMFYPWGYAIPVFMVAGALVVRRRWWLSVLSVLPLLIASVWLAA
jgi:hypothetical protein